MGTKDIFEVQPSTISGSWRLFLYLEISAIYEIKSMICEIVRIVRNDYARISINQIWKRTEGRNSREAASF